MRLHANPLRMWQASEIKKQEECRQDSVRKVLNSQNCSIKIHTLAKDPKHLVLRERITDHTRNEDALHHETKHLPKRLSNDPKIRISRPISSATIRKRDDSLTPILSPLAAQNYKHRASGLSDTSLQS